MLWADNIIMIASTFEELEEMVQDVTDSLYSLIGHTVQLTIATSLSGATTFLAKQFAHSAVFVGDEDVVVLKIVVVMKVVVGAWS